MRRLIVLLCAGVVLSAAVAAPPAVTARAAAPARGYGLPPPLLPGEDAADRAARSVAVPESVGVAIAASDAARRGVRWADCPAGWGLRAPVRCGRVTVPVDYTEPFGASLDLAVDRAASTGAPRERQGALVYDPGGPGGSGLRFPLRSTGGSALWAKTAAAYDFVGFDPRGVGHSAPVSCQDPGEFTAAPKPDPVPRGEADKRAGRERARRYAEGCLRRTGAARLAHMTTPDAARDLDVIRAALGERGLNFLGVSYGSYLGAVYAALFPTHVRRMIVDSVVDPSPDRIWYRDNLAQDVAFENRWRQWEAWVARHDAVYHLGGTAERVQAAWLRLRAQAAVHPVGGAVGPAELVGFFQNAPYYDSAWTTVAGVWSRYAAGDTEALLEAAAPDPSKPAAAASAENANAVYTAVECADGPWPADWRVWDRDTTALNAGHPFLTWSNTWLNLPCASWPVRALTPLDVRGGPGLPGVLIVQSEDDAATPYGGALELHARLAGSRLLTERDAGSHGVTQLANPCVNERVDAYLLTGALGRRDVVCPPHPAPAPPEQRAAGDGPGG